MPVVRLAHPLLTGLFEITTRAKQQPYGKEIIMKTTRTTKTILVISVILLAGAAFAYAHDGGHGPGHHGWGYGGPMMGPGYHGHLKWHGPGWGRQRGWSGLSEKEAAEVEAARENFHNDTKELRGQIDEKAVQLRNEMVKDEPDSGKAAKLQKELSDLRAQFDQKALVHKLEMRKLLPDKFQGRGFGRGGGRGYGGCWRQ
jgi:Spy/CpxP family protein refolding chaperone